MLVSQNLRFAEKKLKLDRFTSVDTSHKVAAWCQTAQLGRHPTTAALTLEVETSLVFTKSGLEQRRLRLVP